MQCSFDGAGTNTTFPSYSSTAAPKKNRPTPQVRNSQTSHLTYYCLCRRTMSQAMASWLKNKTQARQLLTLSLRLNRVHEHSFFLRFTFSPSLSMIDLLVVFSGVQGFGVVFPPVDSPQSTPSLQFKNASPPLRGAKATFHEKLLKS